MKAKFTFLLVVSLLMVFNLSWSQCPEDTIDLGFCDTVHVVPWDAQECESFPCFVHVPLLVTHDSNTFYWEAMDKWVQDSITCFTVPLAWTHTNPTAYCSVSSYWNTPDLLGPSAERSVFRHLIDEETGDTTMINRMMWLQRQWQSWEWDIRTVEVGTDPPYFRMLLMATGSNDRKWWEGERTLLATITFKIQDTMTVCIDTTFWPPAHYLEFCRYDALNVLPRHNMPLCMQVSLAPLIVTSPDGGEYWCVGKTREISWSSEGFPGPFVKIEYSTNAGTSWLLIEDSTQNDGAYLWTTPATPSDSCLISISDAEDGDPYDQSNGFFTIFLAGDANVDRRNTAGDVVYLINYLFAGGPAPIPFEVGDVNQDGKIDSADVVYLIGYLFVNGPAPLC